MAPKHIAELNQQILATTEASTAYLTTLRSNFVTIFSHLAQHVPQHAENLKNARPTRDVTISKERIIYRVKFGYDIQGWGRRDIVTFLLRKTAAGIVAKVYNERKPKEPVFLATIKPGMTGLSNRQLAFAYKEAGNVVTEALSQLEATITRQRAWRTEVKELRRLRQSTPALRLVG